MKKSKELYLKERNQIDNLFDAFEKERLELFVAYMHTEKQVLVDRYESMLVLMRSVEKIELPNEFPDKLVALELMNKAIEKYEKPYNLYKEELSTKEDTDDDDVFTDCDLKNCCGKCVSGCSICKSSGRRVVFGKDGKHLWILPCIDCKDEGIHRIISLSWLRFFVNFKLK